ncbi:Frag1/DRAM/Sfk1 family-domain-containing protein [Hyaloraphidium curvatum]|nr:Frag1/DRAM/Sfk1 family-domain-containing protein [Hyaloraphidium curvatum]
MAGAVVTTAERLLPLIPLVAALCWYSLIFSLLGLWASSGAPRYKVADATVAFISDVGSVYKGLFIGLGTTTAVLFVFTLVELYFLRRRSKHVPGDVTTAQKVNAALTIIFATAGAAFLILLTIYDTVNYNSLHWSFTLAFIVCLSLSALFNALEVRGLHHRSLIVVSPLPGRLIFSNCPPTDAAGIVETPAFTACTITMIGLMVPCGVGANAQPSPRCNTLDSAAAVLEWLVALLIGGYLLTFVVDMWPATYAVRDGWEDGGIETGTARPTTEMAPRPAAVPPPPPMIYDGPPMSPSDYTLAARAPYEEVPFNEPAADHHAGFGKPVMMNGN